MGILGVQTIAHMCLNASKLAEALCSVWGFRFTIPTKSPNALKTGMQRSLSSGPLCMCGSV